MAGKRILLAAEFARGDATLARLLPLAAALAERDHDIILAVPPSRKADVSIIGPTVVDAPAWAVTPPPGFVAVSYADILMLGGYAAPAGLRGLMDGWRGVIESARPDLLIADFAPTAMLAARAVGLPTAAIGDGFSLPPALAPMPSMRPWAAIPADAPDSIEGRVLAVINARLGALKVREIRSLRDLFAGIPAFLCSFPELDHYLTRPNGAWYGAVFPPSRGASVVWPAGAAERIYIDLDPRHPALPALIEVLHRLGLPTLIQGNGIPAHQADGIERAAIHVTTSLNRAELLSGCNIVICQSSDIAGQALLAGKPLLMLPVFVEQMMTLHRVATQGFGHGIEPDSDVVALDFAVRRLVDDSACRQRALNFARNYDGYDPADTIGSIADEIDQALPA